MVNNNTAYYQYSTLLLCTASKGTLLIAEYNCDFTVFKGLDPGIQAASVQMFFFFHFLTLSLGRILSLSQLVISSGKWVSYLFCDH